MLLTNSCIKAEILSLRILQYMFRLASFVKGIPPCPAPTLQNDKYILALCTHIREARTMLLVLVYKSTNNISYLLWTHFFVHRLLIHWFIHLAVPESAFDLENTHVVCLFTGNILYILTNNRKIKGSWLQYIKIWYNIKLYIQILIKVMDNSQTNDQMNLTESIY